MPGSYPDPQLYATTALQALESAYEANNDSQSGTFILTAIEAVKRLQQEIRNARYSTGPMNLDPYEINESNSAI
jgi:hypothetical protein